MCIDANTYKKVIAEQKEDNTFRNLWGNIEALADYFDVVIEEPKTARRMVHRSTAGEIDDKILKKIHPLYPKLSFWPTWIITQTFAKSSTFY